MQCLKRSTLAAAAALAAACILSGTVPAFGASVQAGSGPEGQAAGTEDTAPESGTFDEAIDALYGMSGSITDEEILEQARGITSDGSKLYSELGGAAAKEAEEALSAYEEYKAEYLRSSINGEDGNLQKEPVVQAFASTEKKETDSAVREWDLQGEYTQMMIGEGSCIRELVPRYKVTSCVCENDILELGIEERMTQGYGAPDGSGPLSVSAYSYTFTLSMRKSGKGSGWTPFAINGTESNFTWLREETDPEPVTPVTQEAPQNLYAVQSDLGGQTVAYAQIGTAPAGTDTPASAGNGIRDAKEEDDILSFVIDRNAAVLPLSAEDADAAADADVTTAAAKGYTYKADNAAVYADKYWKRYNRSYKEYRGVDCANFVSQCLYAGGMPKTTDWYPQSVNWINVMGHIRHFKNYGTFVTASNNSVRKGNPVYYDWNGDGTYDHTAICVGTNASGMPIVDGHTNNVFHMPWSMGSRGKRGTILLRPSGKPSPTPIEKNTWKTISGKVYYLGSDGKKVRKTFLTIGGARYYFNGSGVRVTGFFKVRGKHYYASPSNGALVKGWKKINGKWYYFDPKTMVRAKGWKTINGQKCYFNSKGVLKKGKHG